MLVWIDHFLQLFEFRLLNLKKKKKTVVGGAKWLPYQYENTLKDTGDTSPGGRTSFDDGILNQQTNRSS